MINRLASIFLAAVWLCTNALAQTAETDSFLLEQQRIDLQKQQAGDAFDVLEQACAGRFAVNDCVKEVKRQRIARMAALKRDQVALNNAQRKHRAIAQEARIADKATERTELEKENAATHPLGTAEVRQREQAEKQHAHSAKAATTAPDQPNREPSRLTSAEEVENKAAYLQKLQEAEKKRQERAKRLSEKGSAKPLPP
jgi:colicin import membrane protein